MVGNPPFSSLTCDRAPYRYFDPSVSLRSLKVFDCKWRGGELLFACPWSSGISQHGQLLSKHLCWVRSYHRSSLRSFRQKIADQAAGAKLFGLWGTPGF